MPLARTLFIAVVVTACTACTPQGQCEYGERPIIEYCKGTAGCHATLKTPQEWQSSPIAEDWIPFDPYRQFFLYLNDRDGKPFDAAADLIIPYVASDEHGTDSVVASGNLAVFLPCGPDPITGRTNCIAIKNETCAKTFLRVRVTGYSVDAGIKPVSDAAIDAPVDSGDAGD